MFKSVDNMTMKTKYIKAVLRGVLYQSNNTDVVAKYTQYIYIFAEATIIWLCGK